MSNIEWCDVTWNPTRGCSKVSAGCANCYAERTAARQVHGAYAGLVRIGEGSPRWTGEVRLVPEKLAEPLSWRKPRRVFVNSMSDLFHEKLTDAEIARVFETMIDARAAHHTFQVLTKRPTRMLDFATNRVGFMRGLGRPQPPNVWLGVSVENQASADARIPLLLETPAAVRFLSVEPLLGPVDIECWLGLDEGGYTGDGRQAPVDWVIVGGESGPGARPCDVSWIRSVVEQCKAAGVPCFVKQLGAVVHDRNDAGFMGECEDAWPEVKRGIESLGRSEEHQGGACRVLLDDRKGGVPDEWPADLRVREFPEARR